MAIQSHLSPTTAYAAGLLRSFAPFERLPPAAAGRLVRGHRFCILERAAVVLRQGERAPELHCILGGLVKLVMHDPHRSERIVDIVGPGQCFCLTSMWLDLPCPVSAVVLESGGALSLQRRDIIDVAARHPALASRLLFWISWQQFRAKLGDEKGIDYLEDD